MSANNLRSAGLGLVLLLVSACTSVPFDAPRMESFQHPPTNSGKLAELSAHYLADASEHTGVYEIEDGAEALDIRLELAERAQSTIDAQYFLIKPDTAGIAFSASLLRAADRGVRVRLLLDDVFTTARDEGLAMLNAHPNVQIRLFNPVARGGISSLNFLLDFSRANRRMHNKSFTVDGHVTIIGGRNIAAEYFDMNDDVVFWDFELLCFGGLIAEVGDSFDDFWNHQLSVPMEALDDRTGNDELEALRSEVEEFQRAHPGSEYTDTDGLVTRLLDGRETAYLAEAHVLSDDPDKLINPVSPEFRKLASSLGDMLRAAETEVMVFSPYFIPYDGLADSLVELQRSGVNVHILTNSLASTNHVAVHSGYRRYRKQLVAAGVNVLEVSASGGGRITDMKTTLHTKAIMVDRRWLFVGSLNVDPRSIDINTEMGVVIDSTELSEELAVEIEAALKVNAYKVMLNEKGNLRWVALRDGEEVYFSKEPESSWWRRFQVGLYSLLPLEKQL